jgi:tRNA 2-thiouridine synthesizing protein D
MLFTLIVYGDPQASQSPHTALRFAKSVYTEGHQINTIFFYHNSAANASVLAVSPQDEAGLPAQWEQLGKQHEVELVVCIATALRRGILDESEAKRYKRCAGLSAGFRLGGLGELVEAMCASDRVITFAD